MNLLTTKIKYPNIYWLLVAAIFRIANLRSTTRPAQRRACKRKKFVTQEKNCE